MKNIIHSKIPVVVLMGLAFVLSLLLATGKLNNEMATKIAAWIGLVLLMLGSLFMLWDKTALRDSSDLVDNNKPYSFARVQLWWWTLVILGAFLGVYAATGKCWDMNSTCLTLLGISLTTTVSGRMIDTQQNNDSTIVRSQDIHPSQGIVIDILSDENGLSMHRFQSLVFNVSYGLSFLVTVFSTLDGGKFPVYDPMVLSLLGVSSGAYLAMKMNENKTNTNQVAVPSPTPQTPVVNLQPVVVPGDELTDVQTNNTQHPADN